MALSEDLERIADAASARGAVAAVLAAEATDGVRRYLVALGDDDSRSWLVLDDAGVPVTRREDVRDAASIVAMCEVAGDFAGDEAVPRLATPGYLDEVGATAPHDFAAALRAGIAAVDEFTRDVERGYAVELS